VYVNDPVDVGPVRDQLALLPGVARVLAGEERAGLDLRHPRAGDLIALADSDAWFAFPFWWNDSHSPDYAPTTRLQRKPGYAQCEFFLDPRSWWPKGRMLLRLAQKKLGLRTLFDVVPLTPELVRGSHGLPAADPSDRPLLIGNGAVPGTAVLP